jgi:midasin (ATPase involved in ribosome maturation)
MDHTDEGQAEGMGTLGHRREGRSRSTGRYDGATVAEKKTAKEAWDTITTMRVGDDRVKKASAPQLRNQFDWATFKEGESVEDFIFWLNGMVATLAR